MQNPEGQLQVREMPIRLKSGARMIRDIIISHEETAASYLGLEAFLEAVL
jgi:hypothetical protein